MAVQETYNVTLKKATEPWNTSIVARKEGKSHQDFESLPVIAQDVPYKTFLGCAPNYWQEKEDAGVDKTTD